MRVIVSDWEAALLFRNGRFVRVLPSGSHLFLNPLDDIQVQRLQRSQYLQERLVEALSLDRFPLRVSVAAFLKVVDAKAAFDAEHVARAQLALAGATAEAAATLSLEALMTGRETLGALVEEKVAASTPGCRITFVQVTGLTLPPEVRRLFTEVERARLEGEAALQRARGEHASLRSLANAARLLKGNPELMNLRLLQAVGGGPKPATLVVGGSAFAHVRGDEAAAEPDEAAAQP